MHPFLSGSLRSAGATLLLAALCCGAYPAIVTLAARTLFPSQAQGSLLHGPDGSIRGSRLLGQPFTREHYFHPRPSAAGAGYDGLSSGGSNLGPTSGKLRDNLRTQAELYRQRNHLDPGIPLPADAITTSASGLDPHISPANARLQAPRVARARHVRTDVVLQLLPRHADPFHHGINVVTLNDQLDRLHPVASTVQFPIGKP